MNTHQLKIPKPHEYFDNQEYTITTQSFRKKNYNPAFLGDKNFTEDKNRSPDRNITRVTIKVLHSFNTQFKMRHQTAEYTKHSVSIRVHYQIYTINILATGYVSSELVYSRGTVGCTHMNGFHQNVNLNTPVHISPYRLPSTPLLPAWSVPPYSLCPEAS
jgi:hypothetical protein